MDSINLLGKPVSDSIKNNLKVEIDALQKKNIIPKLAAILVGNDSASKIYVNTKHRIFKKMKCESEVYFLSSNITQNVLINHIKKFNEDNKIHGILVQLPLPGHIDTNKVLESIDPLKDVDGFHPENLGYLFQGNPRFIPCTPLGCIEILKFYEIETNSKHIVIVGRSNIVGKPLMALLSQKFKIGNATVTICHTGTKNLSSFTNQADILIAAVGNPGIITSDMIKENAIVLDVGINRINDKSDKGYHLVGDVDYNGVKEKVSAITPVPGGVGPMTITMLLYNTIKAAKNT